MIASSSIPAKGAEGESTNVPNWLELPRDITTNILQSLDRIDIVTCACQVCPLWWNICKDPLMWRTISMIISSYYFTYNDDDLAKICRYAVERSCGHLEVIYIAHFGTDDLLECIAENGSNLRCLRLVSCRRISDKGFSEAVRKLPQLEEVDISFCILWKDCLEVLGRSCPLLKYLKFCRTYYEFLEDDGDAFVIAETMSGLRHLNNKGNHLTKVGLIAILDSCPLLETLRFEGCHNLILSGSLSRRCFEQIKNLSLSNMCSYEDYDSDGDYVGRGG